jgi:hypothetical protein
VALAGDALVTRVGPVPVDLEPVRLGEAVVALAMVAGAVAVVRAQSLLFVAGRAVVIVVFLSLTAPVAGHPGRRGPAGLDAPGGIA